MARTRDTNPPSLNDIVKGILAHATIQPGIELGLFYTESGEVLAALSPGQILDQLLLAAGRAREKPKAPPSKPAKGAQ